ncbi:hypothetical protein [Microvirga mediterraneensis]|uniref:Uncharacterized protein n=1 Tax=Microvirga mediterraneensis TaxID=2754695 RepID=A0A838BM76_9HYPH|nr:hypothetical protein [Microvirga mediterraneensis]MBA1156550.1 hypothetical protein [Microvirga mediterraneensis]
MLKLEEGLPGQSLRTNGSSIELPDELGRLTKDINDLKRRISDQITLIQELTWEAEAADAAKAALQEMRETLGDWYAHRNLLMKLQAAEI